MGNYERSITFQFVTSPDGLIPIFSGSWWIRRGTHSRFSHVDIVYPDGTLVGARNDYHIDVKGKYTTGVQRRLPDYTKFSLRERLVVPVTIEEEKTIYHFIDGQIGKPYDTRAIEGFIVGRDWRNPDAWFCSELAAASLETAGILTVLTPENKVTPNDHYILCGAIGGKRQVYKETTAPKSIDSDWVFV